MRHALNVSDIYFCSKVSAHIAWTFCNITVKRAIAFSKLE